jgi:hypothetical protein
VPVYVIPAQPTYFSCVRNDTLQTIPYSAQGVGAWNAAAGYLAPGQSIVFLLQNIPYNVYPYFTVNYRDARYPLQQVQAFTAARVLTTADIDAFGRVNCAIPEGVFRFDVRTGALTLGPAYILQ